MSYYGKLCTLMYDMDKPFAPKDELAFYKKYLGSKNTNILEPMCGSGRFYIPVLKEGYKIDGFDISQDMLQACIDKCKEIGIEPSVSIQDISNFNLNKKYDLIFIPCGSICLLITNEKVSKSLSNMYWHLNEGGSFLVSFLNENARSENIDEFVETKRKPVDGFLLIEYWKVQYNSDTNVMDYKLKYELIKDDSVVEEEYMDFPIKLYSENEFTEFLLAAGFKKVVKVRIDGADSTLSDEKMIIFECKK